MAFVESLAGQVESESSLSQKIRLFFTPEMMDQVNAVLPGWEEMAAYADGQTLIHVVTAFVALRLCPEYQAATLEQQHLMEWIVLLHDLSKVVRDDQRDSTHSFRSAAMAGRLMSRLGFAAADEASLTQWATLTDSAITEDGIQDNRRLPEILDGIERLFGPDSAAALIVQAVLFHQSIDVVSEWPQAAPLTDAEIHRYISASLLPLLKMMMLVDNDAWAFFKPEIKQRHRSETLAVFRRIEALISLST